MVLSAYRYIAFLHGFKQCRLCFGWCAVYFISQNDVGKQWAANEMKFAFLVQYLVSGNISGHQIRGELYAVKIKIQALCNGFYQQGFCQTGHTHKQRMSVAENGIQHRFHYVVLPDDNLAYFISKAFYGVRKCVSKFFFVHQFWFSQVFRSGHEIYP